MTHLAFIPTAVPLRLSPFLAPTLSRSPHRAAPATARRTRVQACTEPSASPAVPTVTEIPPPARPAFGRGAMMSRRVVGLWELKRENLDPATLVSPDDKVEMRITLGIPIFITSLFIIPLVTGVRLPEFAIAGLCASALGLWAVDTLVLGSRLATTAGALGADRTRVAHHEAGHLLIGYLLGFRPTTYAVPDARERWEGKRPGVRFARCWAEGDAHRVAAVGMAGVVAEGLRYGRCDGGLRDLSDVGRRVRECVGGSISQEKRTAIVRWGIVVAAQLIRAHQTAYDALAADMEAGTPLEECLKRVDALVDVDRLEDEIFDLA